MPKTCFVVGPIGDDGSDTRDASDMLLHMIIKPAAEADGKYAVERADTIRSPGLIDAQIIERLLTCDLVIADMTERNPNAFYEIGIRHMAQKPTIHMQREGEKIPFDVSLYRAIHYSIRNPAKIDVARSHLKQQIDEIDQPGFTPTNPVVAARGFMRLKEDATPPERVLLNEVLSIKERLSTLEHRRQKNIAPTATLHIEFEGPLGGDESKISLDVASIIQKYHSTLDSVGELTFRPRGTKTLIVEMPPPSRLDADKITDALTAVHAVEFIQISSV